MSNPDYTNPNALATLVCQKPGKTGKKPDCVCEPCKARRSIFKHNVGCQEQESRRMALQGKLISSLHEWAPKEK